MANENHYRQVILDGLRAIESEGDSESGVYRYRAVVSTDEPVNVYGWRQSLQHDAESISIREQKTGGIPLLVGHAQYGETPIGRLDNPKIANGRLEMDIVLAKGNRRADDLAANWRENIGKALSVGFLIQERTRDEKKRTELVTKWELFEVSAVAIPADKKASVRNREDTMPNTTEQPKEELGARSDNPAAPSENAAITDEVIEQRAAAKAKDILRQRDADIESLTKAVEDEANGLKTRTEGVEKAIEEIQKEIRHDVNKGESKGRDYYQAKLLRQASTEPERTGAREITMTREDFADGKVSQLETLRAFEADHAKSLGTRGWRIDDSTIHAALVGGQDSRERAAMRELAQEVDETPSHLRGELADGIFIPNSVFVRARMEELVAQRTQTAGTDSAGGEAIELTINENLYKEALYAFSPLNEMGVDMITGLVGTVKILRETSQHTATFLLENAEIQASDITIDSITMNPHRIGARTDISVQLDVQAPRMGSRLIRSLVKAYRSEYDKQMLVGDGNDPNPRGLLNAAGLTNAVSHGVDGGTPTLSTVVEFAGVLSEDNINPTNLAFLTTSRVVQKCRTTPLDAGSGVFLMPPQTGMVRGSGRAGELQGTPIYVSNLMKKDTTKGNGTNLHSMLFGDWSEVVVGEWGSGRYMLVDPHTRGAEGIRRFIQYGFNDIALPRPDAMVKATDISVV